MFSGNIFVFDMKTNKFWMLPEPIIKCSVAKFVPGRSDQVVLGTKNGDIIHIDTSNTLNNKHFYN